MPGSFLVSTPGLFAFLLVLARVGGAFALTPLPGIKGGPEPARIILTLSVTFALMPVWPVASANPSGIGELAAWMLSEIAFGLAAGLTVALLLEAFMLAAQIIGLQAGYAYASTIDPNTQADSGILLVFAQLTAGLLFFALGLDRDVILVFARSLEVYPPGAFVLTAALSDRILALGSEMFAMGIRISFPIIALLILVDVALALLSRINAQMQLLTVAMPVKMLAGLALLAWVATVFPAILRGLTGAMAPALRQLMTH